LVLLNNNFTAIVAAVEQGRIAFDNLKKVIVYLLPAGSWSEMLPVAVNVFLGSPLALSPFLMIVICVLTDVFASLALVHEQAESDIMARRPRNVAKDHLVDWKLLLHGFCFIGMMESLAAFTMFGWHMSRSGYTTSQWLLVFNEWDSSDSNLQEVVYEGQCVFFVTLVVCQIGNLFTTRTRRVPLLPIPNCLLRCFGNCDSCSSESRICCLKPDVGGGGGGAASNGGEMEPSPHSSRVLPDHHHTDNNHEHHDSDHHEPDDHSKNPSTHDADQRQATHATQRHGACPSFIDSESRNVFIGLSCTASIVTAIITTEVQVVQTTFNTRRVEYVYWLVAFACAACLFLVAEMRKWAVKLWPKGLVAKVAW